jgi:hypothetical protein
MNLIDRMVMELFEKNMIMDPIKKMSVMSQESALIVGSQD